MPKKEIRRCPKCRSLNVRKDAELMWDDYAQKWVIACEWDMKCLECHHTDDEKHFTEVL